MNRAKILVTVLAVSIVSGGATADETDCPESVTALSTQIVDLAGMTRLVDFTGKNGEFLGERLARKLDADPNKTGKPRRGAATKVEQLKFAEALLMIQEYRAVLAELAEDEKVDADVAESLDHDAAHIEVCVANLVE